MQKPEITLQIELFGNLVEELNYCSDLCDIEEEEFGQAIEETEERFYEVLAAVREMRDTLSNMMREYRNECEEFDIPIDINYHRIYKQLKETSFGE